MPVALKYTWQETEEQLSISVSVPSVKKDVVSVDSTDVYVKVNAPPYLLQIDLFEEIDEDKCIAVVDNQKVQITLTKRKPQIWGQITANGDKAMLQERREKSLQKHMEAVQKKQAEVSDKRAKNEKMALEKYWAVDDERKKKIQALKDKEKADYESGLAAWQESAPPAVSGDKKSGAVAQSPGSVEKAARKPSALPVAPSVSPAACYAAPPKGILKKSKSVSCARAKTARAHVHFADDTEVRCSQQNDRRTAFSDQPRPQRRLSASAAPSSHHPPSHSNLPPPLHDDDDADEPPPLEDGAAGWRVVAPSKADKKTKKKNRRNATALSPSAATNGAPHKPLLIDHAFKEASGRAAVRQVASPLQVTFTAVDTPIPNMPARESSATDEIKAAEARKSKRAAHDVAEDNAAVLKDKGDGFFSARDYESALNAYTAAIASDNRFLAAISNRAAAYLAQHQYQLCLDDCCAALRILCASDCPSSADVRRQCSPTQMGSVVRLLCRKAAAASALVLFPAALDALQTACDLDGSDQHMAGDLQRIKDAMNAAHVQPPSHITHDRNHTASASLVEHRDVGESGEEGGGSGVQEGGSGSQAKVPVCASVKVLKAEADAAYRAGRVEAAVELYSSALALDPLNQACLSNRAACHLRLHQPALCLADCDHLLVKLRSQQPLPHAALVRALVRRGTAYSHLEQLQQACADFEEALSLQPDNVDLAADVRMLRQRLTSNQASSQGGPCEPIAPPHT